MHTSLLTVLHKEYIFRTSNQGIALRLSTPAFVISFLLALLLVVIIFFSITTGSYDLSPNQAWQALIGNAENQTHQDLIWLFRLPRVCAAMLVGCMMALSGAALQNITRNHLADPSLLGISQGAALAVVASIIIFPLMTASWRAVLALLGAISVTVIIQLLTKNSATNKSIRFILFGIGISAFLSSLTTALLTYGDIYRVSEALAWLAGSLDSSNWPDVMILLITCIVLFPSLLLVSRYMSVLRFGDEVAISLGSPIATARLSLICISVALAAIATAIVGPVGFIGLIAPHAARRLASSGVVMHLIISALFGALLLAGADLIGRTSFAPLQIPAGLLTQIIGVPFFIFLLLKRKSKQS